MENEGNGEWREVNGERLADEQRDARINGIEVIPE